jgi:hypothetical protein
MIQTRKWFTLDALSQQIRIFPFSTRDKPYPITLQNKAKLSGSAAQLWVLLRHILVILSSFAVDMNDIAYELVSKLVEITAMVTAPRLSREELDFLDIMTQGSQIFQIYK